MKIALRAMCLILLMFVTLAVWAGGSKENKDPGKAQKFGKLTLVLHAVHKTVITSGPGGDITAAWLAQHPEVEGIEWITLGISDVHAKLFREASLDKTNVDVGFLMNEYFSPDIANLFEPLDGFVAKDGPEDWADVFASLKEMTKIKNVTYSMPFRTTITGLHYNVAYFKEKGIPEPKQGMFFEDLVTSASALRFTGADGTDVFPYLIPGDDVGNIVDIARAWNGEFISSDFKCRITEKGMINAIKFLKTLYDKGLYPKSFSSITNNDVNTWVQQGRLAMTSQATGKNMVFNGKGQQSRWKDQNDLLPDIEGIGLGVQGRARQEFPLEPRDPEEREKQGPVLELHQVSSRKADHGPGGNERKRSREGIDLCGLGLQEGDRGILGSGAGESFRGKADQSGFHERPESERHLPELRDAGHYWAPGCRGRDAPSQGGD